MGRFYIRPCFGLLSSGSSCPIFKRRNLNGLHHVSPLKNGSTLHTAPPWNRVILPNTAKNFSICIMENYKTTYFERIKNLLSVRNFKIGGGIGWIWWGLKKHWCHDFLTAQKEFSFCSPNQVTKSLHGILFAGQVFPWNKKCTSCLLN